MMCVQFCAFFRAEVAQSVEHTPEKRGVGSSILPLGTIYLLARLALLTFPTSLPTRGAFGDLPALAGRRPAGCLGR